MAPDLRARARARGRGPGSGPAGGSNWPQIAKMWEKCTFPPFLWRLMMSLQNAYTYALFGSPIVLKVPKSAKIEKSMEMSRFHMKCGRNTCGCVENGGKWRKCQKFPGNSHISAIFRFWTVQKWFYFEFYPNYFVLAISKEIRKNILRILFR